MIQTLSHTLADRPLVVTQEGGFLRLGFNQAARGNALSAEVVDALLERITALHPGGPVHTVVLSGSGKHFCTGFDLANLETESEASLAMRFIRLEMLLGALWHAPVRTIAVAQGKTWGAGADMFVACDVRMCTQDATFRFPGPAFGVVLGTGRLFARVGREAARELTVGAATFSSDQALATGLSSRIVASPCVDAAIASLPAETLEAETSAVLRQITCPDHRDADLAALARSVCGGQTKARIIAYRSAQLQAVKPLKESSA
ncbi:enoyl-CoA hydratase/isomerase family protein [Cupriavidus sp. CuC1]|uniref:enoyl-CoA hydratase/isomerase family protein n=1 Tax=Cupriavidus sp. CuC1 TaxID=3373131 RepID=UPI0037D185B0